MLTTGIHSATAKPRTARTARRAVAGWLFAAFGIWMAFSTATTTSDDVLRTSMLVVIGALSLGLLIDATRFALQRRRAPRE